MQEDIASLSSISDDTAYHVAGHYHESSILAVPEDIGTQIDLNVIRAQLVKKQVIVLSAVANAFDVAQWGNLEP